VVYKPLSKGLKVLTFKTM